MDNLFSNMSTEGLEGERDVMGGGGLVDTDYYTGTIELAYAGKSSKSAAQSVTLHVKLDSGLVVRETFWITNGKGENFYLDKKDASKKHMMMGFASVNSAALMSTGLPLTEQTMEEKTVNLYNFEQRKEVPTNVPVITSMVGQKIGVAVSRQIVDKQKANESTGKYEATGETREENVFYKFAHADTMRTSSEVLAGQEEASFIPTWVENNKGKVFNRAKGAKKGSGNSGSGAPAGASGEKPKSSLFG